MTDTERLAWLQENVTRLKLQAGVASITFDPWEGDWSFSESPDCFPSLGEAIDAAAISLSREG